MSGSTRPVSNSAARACQMVPLRNSHAQWIDENRRFPDHSTAAVGPDPRRMCGIRAIPQWGLHRFVFALNLTTDSSCGGLAMSTLPCSRHGYARAVGLPTTTTHL